MLFLDSKRKNTRFVNFFIDYRNTHGKKEIQVRPQCRKKYDFTVFWHCIPFPHFYKTVIC